MPVVTSRKVVEIARSDNPKLAIIKAVGDISSEQVLFDLVLIGIYIQPEKRKSGLYMPESVSKEDEYQGVVGLVLQMGPDAEKLANEVEGPQVGDWVVASIKDGWSMTIKDTPCRLVAYDRLRMHISDPTVIYNA